MSLLRSPARSLAQKLPRRDMLAALAVLAAAPYGFGLSGKALAASDFRIVATTGMLADLMHELGGDAVSVQGLMGPGVDPHTYYQTRSDILAMTAVDLVIWHGLYLEAQLEEFMHDLTGHQQVHALGEAVPKEKLLAHSEYEGRYDPHVWMSPLLWQHVVAAGADVLAKALPAEAEHITANATRYQEQVAGLAAYLTSILKTVPEHARVLVTAHDAFNYFGRDFGFEVVGIQGISTESEAGLKRIETLVDLLVERDVGAVFVESSVSDRNIRALIEGAAARGHKVTIGGELFSDAMGQPGTYEGTYLGMIDHNATVITRALGGTAPARGWQGRLQADG